MKDRKQFEKKFRNPDRRYAIFPVIHDRIVTDPGFADWIERQGFAGVVGNVPYGENYPDDEKEWKETAKGFRRYTDRGLNVWIYDEKGYPSGSARGVVPERNRDFIAEGLYCYEYWRLLTGPCFYRADVPGDKLFRAMLLPLDGSDAIDVTQFADENGTLKLRIPKGDYHLFMMSSRRLFDGTHAAESYSEPRNYISLSDKAATEAFISVTHEKYAKHLSREFGKGVLAFFTDEPSLIAWGIKPQCYPIVPWHRDYPDQFRNRFGYPIELAIVAVVTGRGPEIVNRRCDFWEFIADSVAENYFGTIQEWCHRHGLKSSGHLLHEENLQSHVYNYGSLYRSAKRLDWPGIDMLRGEPDEMMNTSFLPIGRLLASVADISGGTETFTEFQALASRIRNRQIPLSWVRASVNWHLAQGINNFTSYYRWDEFAEQDFRPLNTYVARAGWMLRQGKRDSRTALLYPEAAIWSAYTPSIASNAMDHSEKTMRINNTFTKISWELLHRQIDFDYVDEELLLNGTAEDGKLRYKERAYECVILPEAYVLSRKTVKKLTQMMKNGIAVIVVGEIPSIARETGRNENFLAEFMPFLNTPMFTVIPTAAGWTLPAKALLPGLPRPVEVLPASAQSVINNAADTSGVVDGEIISENILSHVRVLPDGTRIVFLANMAGLTYKGCLLVHGASGAEKADPMTGEITKEDAVGRNGDLRIPFELKSCDSLFWIVK